MVYQAGYGPGGSPAQGSCVDKDTSHLRENFDRWGRTEKGFEPDLGNFATKVEALEDVRESGRGLFQGPGEPPSYDF